VAARLAMGGPPPGSAPMPATSLPQFPPQQQPQPSQPAINPMVAAALASVPGLRMAGQVRACQGRKGRGALGLWGMTDNQACVLGQCTQGASARGKGYCFELRCPKYSASHSLTRSALCCPACYDLAPPNKIWTLRAPKLACPGLHTARTQAHSCGASHKCTHAAHTLYAHKHTHAAPHTNALMRHTHCTHTSTLMRRPVTYKHAQLLRLTSDCWPTGLPDLNCTAGRAGGSLNTPSPTPPPPHC